MTTRKPMARESLFLTQLYKRNCLKPQNDAFSVGKRFDEEQSFW
jgi:hypothetical protein